MLGTFSAWRLGTLQSRALPIAQELVRRGHAVTIVTTPWDQPAEAGARDIIGGVELLNTRTVSPVLAPIAVGEMVRLTIERRPHVVHVFKPRGFGGFAAVALRRRVPVVVDADDWEGDGGWNRLGAYPAVARRMFDQQERRLLSSADVVTAASTLLATRARRCRPMHDAATVVLLPNALASAWMAELSQGRQRHEARQRADDEARVVVYSRFEEIGADWLERFVAALAERTTSRVRVVVVGPGTASVCACGPVVIDLLGYVARDAIPAILGQADVAAFPLDDSLVSRAKQSVKLLELLAAGCPIIASDVGDVARTLGGSGVLVRGSDPLAFASATVSLLNDQRRRACMSSAALQRARQQFCIESVAAIAEEAYSIALGANVA